MKKTASAIGSIEKIVRNAKNARKAESEIAHLGTAEKNAILEDIASDLLKRMDEIQRANQKDVRAAKSLSSEMPAMPAMIDRLTLNEKRIREMAAGLRELVRLPDPVGHVVTSYKRPNGLKISKVRIPLGVVAIIYESRPNVTIDAAALCLKSGNAVILRGGSEAIHSNIFLGKIIQGVLKKHKVSPHVVQVIDTPDREAMKHLVKQSASIDLIIPRGGTSLMRWIEEHAKIPVLKHDKGVCHVFVDASANPSMAEEIVFNAKVQRPGVCNALETLLVHEKIAPTFLPRVAKRLSGAGVEIRGDLKTRKILPEAKKAVEEDWSTEYLDLKLSVKVVPDLEGAVSHIRKYGSLHTEAIVTENSKIAEAFLNRLDSSVVLWNASTRFNDGGQLGLGAEIGISTSKLHAFGPMGLDELTTTKFVVRGTGQVRG